MSSHPPPSRSVFVARKDSLEASGGQTEGMIRKTAIADMCDGICASSMVAKPHSSSGIHHHGEQDTIVFAVSGKGAVVSEGGQKKVQLGPGDFCLIPAYAEHQEVNDGDEEVVWTIVRSGRTPIVHNVKEWNSGSAGQ